MNDAVEEDDVLEGDAEDSSTAIETEDFDDEPLIDDQKIPFFYNRDIGIPYNLKPYFKIICKQDTNNYNKPNNTRVIILVCIENNLLTGCCGKPR